MTTDYTHSSTYHHQPKSRMWMIVPAMMFCIFAYLMYYMPPALDDLIFQWEYLRANNQSPQFSFDALVSYAMSIRAEDNSRIPNIMSPLSTLIPVTKVIFPFLTAALIAAMMVMSARLAVPDRWRSVLTLSTTWLMMILLLPWHDSIFVADYALNYIYSAAVTLAFISCLLYCNRNGWTTKRFVCMIPLTVLAAGWHESFAFPAGFGLLFMTLTQGSKHRHLSGRFGWQWWTIAAIFAATALIFALSPGMLSRASRELSNQAISSIGRIIFLYSVIIGTSGILAILACSHKGRNTITQLWLRPEFKIFASCAIVSAILPMFFNITPRTTFWPNCCCLILLMMLLGKWFSNISIPTQMLTNQVGSALILAICCIQGCYAAAWEKNIYDEASTIYDMIDKSQTGTIFYDIITPGDMPIATLYMPPRALWQTPFQYSCLNSLNNKPFTSVIPTELRNATLAEATPVPGTANAHRFGSRFIIPYADYKLGVHTATITYRNGTSTQLYMASLPFISEKGDTLRYLVIKRNLINPNHNNPDNIVRIDLAATHL